MINSIYIAVLMTLILSYALGKIVTVKLNLLEKLPIAVPLGFFILVGVHEIIAFPFMIWHLPMAFLTILTWVMIGVMTLYCLFNINLWVRLKFDFDLVIVFCFALLLMFFYYNVDNLSYSGEDFNFYIPFVGSNVDVAQINMINPWNGEDGPLSWMYSFQGYYLFISSLAGMLNLDAILVILWFPALLFFIVMPMTLMNVVSYFFKDVNRWLKYIIFIALFCLMNDSLSGMIYPFYGNQFRPLIMIYLIFVYLALSKIKSGYKLFILPLLMFAHFSVQSTGLFIGLMLIVLFMIYETFFNKDNEFEKPLITSLPLTLYGVGIIGLSNQKIAAVALTVLLVIYLSLYLGIKNKKEIMLKLFKVGLILLLVIFVGGSLLLEMMNIDVPVSMSAFFTSFVDSVTYFKDNSWMKGIPFLVTFKIIYIVGTWGLLVLIGINKKTTYEMKLFKVIILGTLVFFYNPLVAPFISKFLTGIVYGRTTILLFSLITFALGINIILEWVQSKRHKTFMLIGVTFVCGVLFLNNAMIHAQDFKLKWITPDPRNDLLYKLPYDLLEAHKALNEYKLAYYQDSNYRPVVLSCDLRTRLINENLKLVFDVMNLRDFYANYETNPYEYRMFMYSIITNSDRYAENEPSVFNDLERRLREYTVEFLIVPANANEMLYRTLQSFASKVYQNDSFVVYHVSYIY